MQANIVWNNGSPSLNINGQPYLPISYRSFYPQPNTVKNFYEKDFSLYHLFPSGILCSLKVPYSSCGEVWEGEGVYNWDNLRDHINMFLASAPDAKFSLLLHLDTRDWYLEEHPEAFDSFHNLSIMCRDEQWRKSATRFIKDTIEFVEREFPDRVYCVHLFAGHTCEWYSYYPENGLPKSPQLTKSYREYFDTQEDIPPHKEIVASYNGVFRHPKYNKKALEFLKFYNEIIAETICFFAKQVKAITDGRLLTGCFYGYTMSLFVPFERGHSAYNTLLNCPDIDMIFSPAAYRPFRSIDATCGFNLAIDSVRLHKKMYLHEIDNTTSLTINNPIANQVQGVHHRPDTLEDTIIYCKKETARGLEHGCGYWWFDMWSGWFDHPKLMDSLSEIKKASKVVYETGTRSVSEIAVFIDSDSAYYLASTQEKEDYQKSNLKVHKETVYFQQQEFNKMGAPVMYYDVNDLLHPEFPHNQCKLYIFPNLYAPTNELKATIESLRSQGKSCLFLYASGYIGDEDYSLTQMKELTGFNFTVAESETQGKILSCEDEVCWGNSQGISPMFAVQDNSAHVLAHYCQSGLPAGCVKQRGDALDAWFGWGPVPAAVLRKIAKMAGVFIWHEGDDPIYVNEGMFGMYCHDGGARTINVPENCTLVNLYDTENIVVNNEQVMLDFQPKEFKLYARKPV